MLGRVGIHLTEHCNITCAHCGTNSSPYVHLAFKPELLRQCIEEIASLNSHALVALTGGEIFASPDLLDFAIALIRDHGLKYGVTTNGFWTKDRRRRDHVFNNVIPDCTSIGFSLDRYHAAFIPERVVVEGFLEARRRGFKTAIRYTISASENEEDVLQRLGLFGTEFSDTVDFCGVMAVGRAANTLPPSDFVRFKQDDPCTAATLPTIRPNGGVYACCGESFYLQTPNPLFLGSLTTHSLRDILGAAKACPTLRAIRTLGPVSILKESQCDRHDEDVRAWSPCGSCRLMLQSEEARSAVDHWSKSQSARTEVLDALIYGRLPGCE